MEREGCSESMLNYSATATQVVTCSRCFLQRFNPGPRDSIWAFYSLLGAVAMGLCMLRRARCTVHGKQFACADWESKVGAESVRSRLKKPHREHKHDETRFDSATFYCIFFLLLLLLLLFTFFNVDDPTLRLPQDSEAWLPVRLRRWPRWTLTHNKYLCRWFIICILVCGSLTRLL